MSQVMQDKIKSIRIETENGEVYWAEGDTATELWMWLIGCEHMASVHGFKYNGPHFTCIPPGASA